MHSKIFKYTLPLLLLTVFLGQSCKKEILLNSGGELLFSVDTLMFDTVFSTQGSFTASLKIYNPQDQKINISSVRLFNGSQSQFHLNVNGVAGNKVDDIEVAAKDSIYVFATVNVNPGNVNDPFVVEDKMVATLNGKDFSVPFLAYGQDAYYIVDSLMEADEIWKTDKPYVIIHNAAVDEGVTLTIPAGCRIYVHADSRLLVLGTLLVNGTKTDSVVFQGDRLDRKYFGNEGYPGEWGGIYFFPTSKKSVIKNAILRNCGNSTKLSNGTFSPAAIQINFDTIDDKTVQLTLLNTVIENSIGYGILSFGGSLYAENCLIHTTGAQALAAFQGGSYFINNCSFINYGTNKVSHVEQPTMALLNYYDIDNTSYYAGPLKAIVLNSVIWGTLEDELFANKRGNDLFDVTLENCVFKTKEAIHEDVKQVNCKANQDPMFKDPGGWDFHLQQASPLIDAGKKPPYPADYPQPATTDLDDKSRDINNIDIGCYEYQP